MGSLTQKSNAVNMKLALLLYTFSASSNFAIGSICTDTNPCKENQGECILDSHCENGLVCGQNNCISPFISNCCQYPERNGLIESRTCKDKKKKKCKNLTNLNKN